LIAQFGSNSETAQRRETHQLSGIYIETNCFPFFLYILIDGKLFFPYKTEKGGTSDGRHPANRQNFAATRLPIE
jgi:hypothetical protein